MRKVSIQRKCKIFWLIIVFIWVGSYIAFDYIGYETNDDFFLGAIVGGAYGNPTPYMIHTNYFYGVVLYWLSVVFPWLNWMNTMSVVGITVAYLILGFTLIERIDGWWAILISTAYLFNTSTILLNMLNYSKSAGFLMSMGLFGVAHSLTCKGKDEKQTEKRKVIICGLCAGWGALMRWDSFMAMLPFVFLFFVLLWKRVGNLRMRIAWIGFILLISASYLLSEKYFYQKAEWEKFREYNEVRESVMDYENINYDANREKCDAVGWSSNDVEMLNNWNQADPIVFSAERFKNFHANRERSSLSLWRIKKLFCEFAKQFLLNRTMILMLGLNMIIVMKGSLNSIVFSLAATAVSMAELIGLLYLERTPDRAVYIAMYGGIAVLLFLLSDMQNYNLMQILQESKNCFRTTWNKHLFALVLLLWCLMSSWLPNMERSYIVERQETLEFLREKSQNDSALYVWNISNSRYLRAIGMFESFHDGLLRNVTYSGGWMYMSPVTCSNRGKFLDCRNIYELAAKGEEIYFVEDEKWSEDSIEMKVQFVKEHYCPNAQAIRIESYNGLNVYKIVQ